MEAEARKRRASRADRARGRLLRAVKVDEAGTLKTFWFELRPDGLHVREFRRPRKKEVRWSLERLVNGAWGDRQMDIFR